MSELTTRECVTSPSSTGGRDNARHPSEWMDGWMDLTCGMEKPKEEETVISYRIVWKYVTFIQLAVSQGMSAFPIIISRLVVLVVVAFCLNYYGNRRRFAWYVQATALVSWFLPFTIVFLLPFD